MKAKHIVHTLSCLIALSLVGFFVMSSDAQVTEDPWEAWIDEQTDTVLKSAGEMDEGRRAEMRASIRAKFSALATELKKEIALPPQAEDDVILQLEQIQKRLEKLEEKDRRISIFDRLPENYHSRLERNWEIERAIEKALEDLESTELPKALKEFPNAAKKFSMRVLKVPQTVKALRDAYDEKYNERYATTSGSISHTRDGITVFSYQFPLPMSEVDAKYPRDAWLQMLLDRGISIDNFEEYWTYLSQRDTLVELEKQPEVWSSGLFGIPSTNDWETYKEAYLKQMVGKFHKEIVYFGRADVPEVLRKATEHLDKDAAEALRKATEHLEKLEHYRLPPLDR